MTAQTLHPAPTEAPRRPLVGIDDLVAVTYAVAELSDTPETRYAVAAITATMTERADRPELAPDPRDVPLVVRQRELAVAARRLDLPAHPGA